MIKMVFCVRKRESVTEEDFCDYWLNQHGPLVRSQVEILSIRRYVQSHTKHKTFGHSVATERGMKVPGYDGVAELWWDDMEALQGALSTEAGQAASSILAEDEARFIDMESSTIFFTEEYVVTDS